MLSRWPNCALRPTPPSGTSAPAPARLAWKRHVSPRKGHVWAIENEADAANARTNAAQFRISNATLFDGKAPQGLETWPDPDAVFIGGFKANSKKFDSTDSHPHQARGPAGHELRHSGKSGHGHRHANKAGLPGTKTETTPGVGLTPLIQEEYDAKLQALQDLVTKAKNTVAGEPRELAAADCCAA